MKAEQIAALQWEEELADLELQLNEGEKAIVVSLDELKTVGQEIAKYKVLSKTADMRIKMNEQVKKSFEIAKIATREVELKQQITETERETEKLESEIKKISTDWLSYFKKAIEDLKLSLEETDNKALIELLKV